MNYDFLQYWVKDRTGKIPLPGRNNSYPASPPHRPVRKDFPHTVYLCILEQNGVVKLHRNIRTKPDLFLKAIEPFREDLVITVESMFSWYWLANLCAKEDINFVLGHALYMGAIHGGKSKNDKIDSQKIALLLKGGMIPKVLMQNY